MGEYLRVYRGLIEQELEDELEKGQEKQNNLILHKEEGNIFFFGDEIGYKCRPNDSIIVEATDSTWSSQAILLKKLINGEFHIKFAFGSSYIPDEVDISVYNKSNPNRMIISGLDKLASLNIDQGLMSSILRGDTTIMKDPDPGQNYNVLNLFTLNPSQTEAVARALKYKCSVIQGPPGTGKTETAAAIIYHILHKCSSENSVRQDFDIDNSRRNNEEAITRERNEYNNNIAQRTALKKALERTLISAIIDVGNKRIDALTGHPKSKGRTRLRSRDEQEELNNVREKVTKAEDRLRLLNAGEEYDDNFIRDMINHDFCNFEKENGLLISEYLAIIQELIEPIASSIPEIRDLTSSLFDYRPEDRILVCTFSNTAIKVLKQRLISKGIKSLQIYGKMQEETDENINDPDSLHYILRNSEEYKRAEENIKRFEQSQDKYSKKLRAYDQARRAIDDLWDFLEKFKFQWRERMTRQVRIESIEYILRELKNYMKNFGYQRQMLQGQERAIDNIDNSMQRLITALNLLRKLPGTAIQQATELRKIEDSINYLLNKLDAYFNDLRTRETMDEIEDIKEKFEKLEDHLKILKNSMEQKKSEIEKQIISKYRVICCTCVSSNGPRLNNLEFKHIVIDEATQALEPVTALCLLKNPVHLVIIGDPRQLGCLVKYPPNTDLGLAVPMIERLMDSQIPRYLLKQQYRMHPDIAEFSNGMFYDNRIQNSVTAAERDFNKITTTHPTHPNTFNFPGALRDKHTFFLDVTSQEEYGGNGKSFLNRKEVETIADSIKHFYGSYVDPSQIGIITFYDAQRGYINNYLAEYFDPKNYIYYDSVDDGEFLDRLKPNIMSVDSCQGKEFDFVILSCVRNSQSLGIGFLDNPQRMNVAMTRARFGLIIIGNVRSLLKTDLGKHLIHFYWNKGLIFDGNDRPFTKGPPPAFPPHPSDPSDPSDPSHPSHPSHPSDPPPPSPPPPPPHPRKMNLNLEPIFNDYVVPTQIRYRD